MSINLKEKKNTGKTGEKERLYIWKAIKNHSECAAVIAFLQKQTREAVWNVKGSYVKIEAQDDGHMARVQQNHWRGRLDTSPPSSFISPLGHARPGQKMTLHKTKQIKIWKNFFRKHQAQQPFCVGWEKPGKQGLSGLPTWGKLQHVTGLGAQEAFWGEFSEEQPQSV